MGDEKRIVLTGIDFASGPDETVRVVRGVDGNVVEVERTPGGSSIGEQIARMRADGVDTSNMDVVIGKLLKNARELNTKSKPTILMQRQQAKATKKSARKREKESRRQMAALAAMSKPEEGKKVSREEHGLRIMRDILSEQAWVTKLSARRERKGDSPETQKAIEKASARVVELVWEAEEAGIILPLPPQIVEAVRRIKEAEG